MTQGKSRTTFVCQECGAQTPKSEGRCPQCGQWNSIKEVQAAPKPKRDGWLNADSPDVQELSAVSTAALSRIGTPFGEMDRVLGGGIVPGSLILMAGDPGIGKSTLLLQTSGYLAGQGHRLLYVSGEESAQQVRLRAQRLGVSGEGLFFLGETEVEQILAHMETVQPFLVVVDSVQTMSSQEVPSAPGSVAQVRECTRRLMQWAKGRGVPILLAGHVTKDGAVAGPRALEHMVDVVLYLEGDTLSPYRILRGAKNRFGSTNEIGVFQMGQQGLEEVSEPSLLFLSSRLQDVSGSVVIVSMEGSRPLLAEVQALTTPTVFSQPRRVATGVDFHRLLLVAAATTQRLGIPLGGQDIIVNLAGGLRVGEPAADLGIALALVSSFRNTPCDPATVAVAEVGLGGELRSVPQLERRLKEAARLGFRRAVIAQAQISDALGSGLELIATPTLADAVRKLFPRMRHRNGRQGNDTIPFAEGSLFQEPHPEPEGEPDMEGEP
ncbi:MAG: radA [Dehalococcoidia bacterium]|nr:radA [Dehalococcoidia bacterium]